ncbi:MAG: MtrB/PioB family decaheme-associated outer membrane protein [Gammaproteobacteria bacterium]|nr:MtrB/PioB family decaheme-associated outer membrane protein [Gammaproteobacteria bacterium]MDE1984563.1 MtrB/PioB family decaheme-associated outer membrane protein [Gammaproteobacteria bacterium]
MNRIVEPYSAVRRRRSWRCGQMLALAMTACAAISAYADSPAPSNGTTVATPLVDTSLWTCQFCTYVYGWSGQLDAGLGRVSSSSYKFGEYTGLQKSGSYLLLGGALRYRDPNGRFFDLSAGNLGIASRTLSLDQGKQGVYTFTLDYQEIPQFLANSGRTPFLGLGSDRLTLPGNWLPAGSTQQMSTLAQDLHFVDISNIRRTTGLGLKLTPPASRWQYSVHYQRDTQNGNELMGGNFLTTTSQLPAAIDYTTNQIRARADYNAATWQLGFGYYGSFFDNANSALTWSNPFLPITPSATQGQMAQAPSNNFNQLSFSGGWQALSSTRLMASASVGRITQNAAFLTSTLNAQLAPAPLPAGSLNGEVDTLDYALRAYANILPALTLTADYTVSKRNNHTPQAAYQQVITDTYISRYLTNLPYSFTRSNADISLNYQFSARVRLQAGASHARDERTFQDAGSTRTDMQWAGVMASPTDNLWTQLKFTHESRFSPNYNPVDYLFAPQNPLMRQFDLANLTRNQILGQASYTPNERWSVGSSVQSNNDRYNATTLGLTQSKDINFNVNASYAPAKAINYYVYFNQENTAWRQAGSGNFAAPNWTGDQEDTIKTVGLGAKFPQLRPGLDSGVEFSYSLVRGATAILVGPAYQFPNLSMRLQSLGAFAKYRLNDKLALRLDYRIERYVTADWSVDGVNPNTIPNVLALGIYSPNYVVNVVSVTAQYSF